MVYNQIWLNFLGMIITFSISSNEWSPFSLQNKKTQKKIIVLEGERSKIIFSKKVLTNYHSLSQPHFEGNVRSPLTLPKMGLGSPLGLSKIQNSIARVKTPRIEVFFIPLQRSWNVDVQNGLTWAIWMSAAQVMVEKRVESQTGSLTPDHWKSRIDPIPACASGMRHTIGKLSRRAINLF